MRATDVDKLRKLRGLRTCHGRRSRRSPQRNARRAFTLAESLLASVVLALAVIGVSATLSASHSQSGALTDEHYSIALARQLMEEIVAKPLVGADATPGWPTEKDRRHYDTVNDYDGYHDAYPFRTLEGDTADIASTALFSREANLLRPATLFGTAATPGDMVVVQVTTADASGRRFTLSRLVARVNVQR